MPQNEEERAYRMAERSLALRSHSAHELRKKLLMKGICEEAAERVISRLSEKKYLDDRRFAGEYIEYGFLRKSWGMVKVRAGLMARGIAREIIDEALSDPNIRDIEVMGARRFVEKNLRHKSMIDDAYREELQKKLKGRGYNWEVVSLVTREL